MEKRISNRAILEQKRIIKYIFQGLSNTQIAEKMHYSRSTISYRVNLLFKKYGVSSRHELILAIIAQLSLKNKETIQNQNRLIDNMTRDLERFKDILKNIVINFDKGNELHYSISEAKTLLNVSNLTY